MPRLRVHLATAPVPLGKGESLFTALELPKLGFRCTEHVPTANATHFVLSKRH